MYNQNDQIMLAIASICLATGMIIGMLASRIQQLEDENARLARISILTTPTKSREEQAQ